LARSVGRTAQKLGLALFVAAVSLAPAVAETLAAEAAVVALSALPPEAQQTESLIRRGGPFPFAKDGSVFGNREGLLPRQSRGHYREYTVRTSGSQGRGARRIVCGGAEAAKPQACYYTADHYASFRRIVGDAGSLASARQSGQ